MKLKTTAITIINFSINSFSKTAGEASVANAWKPLKVNQLSHTIHDKGGMYCMLRPLLQGVVDNNTSMWPLKVQYVQKYQKPIYEKITSAF